MNVVIAGGTGFIGRNVAPVLVARGHAVVRRGGHGVDERNVVRYIEI